MLRLKLDKNTENLRQEFQEWLSRNPLPRVNSEDAANLNEFIRQGRIWQSSLSKDKWVGVHWPKEYGGRGLTLVEEAIIQEELAKASAPQLLGLFGLTMVGPVLIQHGTNAQRGRFLPKILDAVKYGAKDFLSQEQDPI
jgi:alkylation response protein AidB-like acyl-CoA dehydrogenase